MRRYLLRPSKLLDQDVANSSRHVRTLFLSDIHLGTKGCQAEALLDFLDHHTCDHLFLVGDIIDGWRLKSSFYWPSTHTEIVRRFLEMANNGTKVTFVTGNHDEFLRRYTDLVFHDLSMVDESEHITADGRRLLVIHGDQFDVVTRYHKWLALWGDVGYGMLLVINRWVNQARRRFGFGYFSLSAWVKYRVKQAVNFIGQFEDSVAYHCHQRSFEGVVCGHIHHAEIRDINGIDYMNCGDWVESCTAIVEDQDGQCSIVRWVEAPTTDIVISLPEPVVVSAAEEPRRSA